MGWAWAGSTPCSEAKRAALSAERLPTATRRPELEAARPWAKTPAMRPVERMPQRRGETGWVMAALAVRRRARRGKRVAG